MRPILRAALLLLAVVAPCAAEPLPVGHRGLFRHVPENTLAGFAAYLELRLGLELDVRRSKDGHLVVLHDDDLKRTTAGSGKVSDHTLEQLRKLDAGRWFDPAFAGQHIPTLADVFRLVKERGHEATLIAVDIKIDDGKVEADIVRLANKHGVLGQIVCIGTTIESAQVRKRLRAADPKAPAAVLAPTPAGLAKALEETNANWIYLRFIPTREQVDWIHKSGKKVFLSGKLVAGKETENWRKAKAAGVDALLTDHPLACRQSWRSTDR